MIPQDLEKIDLGAGDSVWKIKPRRLESLERSR